MDKTISIEEKETKDYEVEVVNLKLHEKAVIPREFFPYSLFIRSEIGDHYYGRIFLYEEPKGYMVSLYFKLEQDEPENIIVEKIAEREYLEELSNAMLRR